MFKISASRFCGEIVINSFNEHFKLAKGYWTTKNYKANWELELKNILNPKRSTCCLITWMNDPKNGGNYRGWVLYKRNKKILIIDKLWPVGILKPRFRNDQTIIIKNETPKGCSIWKMNISDIKTMQKGLTSA